MSSAHSFVLGLDGFEQSMQLYRRNYSRTGAKTQYPEIFVDEWRAVVYS